MNSIWFVIKGNNNFHKLELSKTLLHFTEFDFTYFWEQCIEAGKNARKFGSLPESQLSMAKNSIFKCHPYLEAKLAAEAEMIALDCIIEFICHSEKIGLEDLWSRCISPKNSYERQIFKRISEYKTNRAINQWVNIVRVQEYAKKKLEFIFGGEDSMMLKAEDFRVRKDYFDLCFSVVSNEFGMTADELPYTRVCNPSVIPDAPFVLSKVAKSIYKRFSGVLQEAETGHYVHATDAMRDQMALDAFSNIKNMSRPAEFEMHSALEAFADIPAEVYMPNSFKAVIDLEFDLMIENGIFMQKCEKCGRYFTKTPGYDLPYCNRVTPSGKTCREIMGREAAAVSGDAENTAVNSMAADNAAVHAGISDSVKRSDVVPDNIPSPEQRYPAVNAGKWDIFNKNNDNEPKYPKPGSTEFEMDDILSKAQEFLEDEEEAENAPSFEKAANDLSSDLSSQSAGREEAPVNVQTAPEIKPEPKPEQVSAPVYETKPEPVPEPAPAPRPEPVRIIRQAEAAADEPKPFRPPVIDESGEIAVPAEPEKKAEKPMPEIKPFRPPVLNPDGTEAEEKTEEEKAEEKIPVPFNPPVFATNAEAAAAIAIDPELEKRCQKMYNSLYKKVGKSVSEEDFREWSQYLSNMKRNVKNGEAPESDLLGFIEYSEKTYGSVKTVGRPRKNAQ